MFFYILFYLIINFLLILIWWTIPGMIYLRRQKYGLPPRMVIWPISKEFMENECCAALVVTFTIIGSLMVIPGILIYTIVYIVRQGVNRIAFSKEERVQIAIGTIEKREDE